ncbi:type IV secretion system protein [Undibacterium arcticum]
MDAYYKDRKVFDLAATRTIVAEVTLALPTAGNTWQIEWTETTRNQSGDIILTERWKGVITYDFVPMDSEQSLRANPAGIYVTDFSWSKQI